MREYDGSFTRRSLPAMKTVSRLTILLMFAALLTILFVTPCFAEDYALKVAPKTAPPADSVTVIGDSVTLGAKEYANMQGRIDKTRGISWCKVDAKVSRHMMLGSASGVKLAKQLKQEGKLGNIVVYSLSTNSIFKYKDAKAAFEAVGKDRYVVFVTGYVKGHPFTKIGNAAVKKLAAEEKRVFVADWYKLISGKKNQRLSDNYCHLTRTSGNWYVDVIRKAIVETRAAHVAAYRKKLARDAKLSSAGTVNIAVGDVVRAPVGYLGVYVGERKILRSSNNSAALSIDRDGNMAGLCTGTAIVTVRDDAKPASKVQFAVHVNDSAIPVTDLGLRVERVNEWALRLVALPSPAVATGVPVFSSSDKKVAAVNSAGLVVGGRAGKADITVRFGEMTRTIRVIVK